MESFRPTLLYFKAANVSLKLFYFHKAFIAHKAGNAIIIKWMIAESDTHLTW